MLAGSDIAKTTTHKVVLPFYIYAALAFVVSAVLLLASSHAFSGHYFQPKILAVTHAMALGWGTMIILGASHQLLPVLTGGKLYSPSLAYLSFIFSGTGIPLLVWAFYIFDMHWPAQYGAVLVNTGVLLYLINVGASIDQSRHGNVHATFIFTAGVWLFITTAVGGFLVFNFTAHILPENSLHYLSLHAHIGIAGWFLLLVIGVGSRLIPMFLISKFNHPGMLWWMYFLINGGLVIFLILFLLPFPSFTYLFPAALVAAALVLFGAYCRHAYRQRIRKQVDGQMKISLLSVLMMIVPMVFLFTIIAVLLLSGASTSLVLAYGFTIFFGWLTALILGMTFKTLPFIVWNKTYHAKAGLGKTPHPKDLFSSRMFNGMAFSYLAGFVCFAVGILAGNTLITQAGAVLLLCSAVLYSGNVFKIFFHKATVK